MKRNVSYILEDEGMYSNRNQLVERIKYQRLSYVLDFCFNIFDCVRRFDVEGDGFSGERFDEYLHAVVDYGHIYTRKCHFSVSIWHNDISNVFLRYAMRLRIV